MDKYNVGKMWVPVSFIRKSENIITFLKLYILGRITLYDFILLFENRISYRNFCELKADYDILEIKLKLNTTLEMEKQMAETYTPEMFYKFQNELMMTISYMTKLVKDNGEEATYIVSSLGTEKEIQRLVIFKKKIMHHACSM